MVATAQAVSGGRVILGIGAGWNQEEYLAYGWPFPPAPVRIAQLGEAIEVVRLLWRESPASYRGAHYQVSGAHCEPRPDPIPPIMVGGHGEKHLLRVVAQHADWWNYIFRDTATYARKQEVLKRHCREVGRDYDAITQVARVGILIAETDHEVARLRTAPHVRPMTDIQLAGTPAQVTEVLRGVIAQGARRLTVNFADAPRPEGTWLFASTVLPNL
jgi:alkanesulfonate monooxygenase SsuD/methylene tetrahydromethanopterin reductase-like flavin-dependent oxidoreductase (luciferase family)